MEGIEQEDPMEWDLNTVYFELSSRPWVQNPDALVAMIVDQGLDGKTLLTFEHLFSRRELMEVLGFSTARQKALMVEEIVSLQARSSAYRSWKKAFNRKLAMGESLDTDPHPEVDLQANHANHAKETPRPVNGEVDPAPADPALVNGSTSAEHASPTQNGVASNAVAVTELNHDDNERPLKKRRIVPTNINTEPLSDVALFAPEFRIPDPAPTRINHDDSTAHPTPYAYLGSNVLDFEALKSHAGPAHPQVIELSDGSFAVASRRFPPGARQVVAGTMRNILARNGRHERLLKQGLPISRSPSPPHDDDDDDDDDDVDDADDADDQEDVVDASDLPDEWDEQTRREIEEEQAEVAARERELARCLSPERVEAILQGALGVMKAKWEERKLPQHKRKAFKIWTAARKTERIKGQILEAHRLAQFHDSKIMQMMAEILKDKWVKEQDVRDQALIMEQRLHDKLHQSWLASILESRVPPEQPIVVPRPRDSAPKPRPSFLDDEVLTSDDDSLDGFIVEDEEPPAVVVAKEEAEDVPMMDQLPHTPSGSGPAQGARSPVMLDLTQIETSPEPEPSIESRPAKPQQPAPVVNLTTPDNGDKAKAELPRKKSGPPDDSLPPTENLGDVQTIAQSTPKSWSENTDRWRMVISMIFKFGHDRRQRLFSFIRGKTPEEIWESSIRKHLDGSAVTNWDFPTLSRERLVGIDLAIVLLSHYRCKPVREKRIWQLDRRERNEIRRLKKKALWPNLVAFLRDYAPRFPTDDQILRVDAPDDWIDGQDIPDDDDAAGPSSARRRAPREIVQDKDALALRKEEERRLQKQEERRKKLRAQMESAGVTSKDRRRLIINESKEEDQALIYVNKDIGSRIKDHQINGVRFLWNQIIRDVDVRQGCLLAHTMGLGKTMQVITFLVSIVEAASSTDLSVLEQIPDDLKRSQTLVICPAGLVENWIDEVLRWAPKDILGSIRKVESAMPLADRHSEIRSWAESGGLLIMGYEMFQGTCSEGNDEMEKLLIDTPSIIIADEAHYIKNPTTKINQACSKFRTRSRIALTGTPLSNNVEEYYSMIDWVAPNFLGPLKEFKETYSIPINQGLELDSGAKEKKEALKRLEVLKRTIAPKVNRADISSIKGDLPPKHEFVLFVSRTEMQKTFYNKYIDANASLDYMKRTFAIANDLTLICNHPRCYEKKVKTPRKERETKAIMDTEVEAAAMVEDQMIAFIHKETQSQDMNDPGLSQKVKLLLLILDEARRLNEKVIVFSQSIPTLDYLETLLSTIQKRTVCRLDGDTKVTVRHEVTKNFNKGLYDVYLISSKAGGVGLNIQGANRVVIFDIKWNPAVTQQAIGRAYRIGQTKTVYVYHLMVAGTFEEVLHDSSVFKMQLASRVVDKKNPVSWGKRCGSFGPVKDKPALDLTGFLNRDSILDRLIEHSREDGQAINRIISTDTFEEEDLSAQVTPEMNVQIEEFMKLEEMRRSDLQGYEKEMLRRQTSTGRYYSSLGHSMDGASDGRYAPSQTPTPGPSTVTLPIQSHQVLPYPQSIPVPPPMVGANTYFRGAGAPQSAGGSRVAAPQVRPIELVASAPLPKKGGIFGPSQSHARDDFEKKLVQKLSRVQCVSTPSGEPLEQVAERITARIAESLREQAEGILYDNSRWSLLSKLIDGERFLWALATERLRIDFLVRAKAEQLEQRMSLLESFSDAEIVDHFMRIRTPDPSNLGNIGRSRSHSARATEDLEAMQQLARQRRQRGTRLPPWASQALSQNLNETSTPRRGN